MFLPPKKEDRWPKFGQAAAVGLLLVQNYPSYYYCCGKKGPFNRAPGRAATAVSALHGVDMTDDFVALFRPPLP